MLGRKRPTINAKSVGLPVARPEDASMAELLGYASFEGVGFTRDQMERLKKYYGFTDQYNEDRVAFPSRIRPEPLSQCANGGFACHGFPV